MHGKCIPESVWARWSDCANELWLGQGMQQLSRCMDWACKGAWLSWHWDQGLDLCRGLTDLAGQPFGEFDFLAPLGSCWSFAMSCQHKGTLASAWQRQDSFPCGTSLCQA